MVGTARTRAPPRALSLSRGNASGTQTYAAACTHVHGAALAHPARSRPSRPPLTPIRARDASAESVRTPLVAASPIPADPTWLNWDRIPLLAATSARTTRREVAPARLRAPSDALGIQTQGSTVCVDVAQWVPIPHLAGAGLGSSTRASGRIHLLHAGSAAPAVTLLNKDWGTALTARQADIRTGVGGLAAIRAPPAMGTIAWRGRRLRCRARQARQGAAE